VAKRYLISGKDCMSRIGKQPIHIPPKTEVSISDGEVLVSGPLGELRRAFRKADVTIELAEKEVVVHPKRNTKISRSLWGTYASHIRNMIKGVNEPFEKRLIVDGIGYRVEVSGNNLVLLVGYSHPVTVAIPEGLSVSVEKNVIKVSGRDKEMVGEFAATVRSKKKPEPYKGKGIRYYDEIIRRKQGKRAVA